MPNQVPVVVDGPDAPQLTPEQLVRLALYGVLQEVRRRDVVFRPGDPTYDLIVIAAGRIEIVSPPTCDEPEAVVATYGPGEILGELNLLTGQNAGFTGRVIQAGRIHRISADQFRQLMSDDPQITDVLLRTLLARRDVTDPVDRGVDIIGSSLSADALALRNYAARQRLAHLWLDADSAAGLALMRAAALAGVDLPAVVTPERVVRRANPRQLAASLGLFDQPPDGDLMDLVIIGSGPAGLSRRSAVRRRGSRHCCWTASASAVGPRPFPAWRATLVSPTVSAASN